MLVRLTLAEVTRLLRRPRFWILLLLAVIAFAAIVVSDARHPNDVAAGTPSGLVYPNHYASGLMLGQLGALALLSLVLPFVVCDTFANDRKTRYIGLLVCRRARRWKLVTSRVLAGGILSLLSVAVVSVVLTVAALALAEKSHGEIGAMSAFLPDLLNSHPVAYFALVIGSLVLTSTGVLAMGALVGVFTKSWLAAVLVPPLVILGSQFAPLPDSLVPYSPGARATFVDYGASWATPQSSAAYWAVAIILFTAAAIAIYHRKEDL